MVLVPHWSSDPLVWLGAWPGCLHSIISFHIFFLSQSSQTSSTWQQWSAAKWRGPALPLLGGRQTWPPVGGLQLQLWGGKLWCQDDVSYFDEKLDKHERKSNLPCMGLKWSTLTSHFSVHFCTKGAKFLTGMSQLPKNLKTITNWKVKILTATARRYSTSIVYVMLVILSQMNFLCELDVNPGDPWHHPWPQVSLAKKKLNFQKNLNCSWPG